MEIGAKHKGKEFGKIMETVMTETANKYLEPYSDNIRMRADGTTILSWTK